ncbi:endonuclease/exonuclease/phosphatase family protein [Vibrio aquaticus]|uniref:Endonuclease/exonuclease/phosphatase family protein n=1 Tax=Vibrio aquaticus TaxID=2496559 RepID=A0A3S0PS01_9VIBR|nr:endonuclease/exonuclease/phosphatase family protein [Vibrio aquaticus]RTZ18334.1 endonuclease/exonuclease/phosphatase family protein [Vibrio aquaticus]
MRKYCSLLSVLPLITAFNVQSETLYSAWNLEWLSNTPSEQFSSSQRSSDDYQSLQRHFESMQSDVVAFQEVNDKQALRKVIGNDYTIYMSQRAKSSNSRHQFDDINQYTGFAVNKGVPVKDMPDLKLDGNRNSKLRFASYVVIEPDGKQPVHALSVHLKARCSGAFNGSKSCKTLKEQGQHLNKWILEREKLGDAYIILGDFNHNMVYRGDWLWKEITQGSKAELATQKTRALCKVKSRNNPSRTHQFRSLIDHIIVSHQLDYQKPKQDVYPVDDVLKYQLSDHCPVSMSLN